MKNLLLFSVAIFCLFSCREDFIDDSVQTSGTNPPVVVEDYEPDSDIITGTVSGYIFNETNDPIENATIKLRGENYTSDANGFFLAKDVNLDAEGTFYTVEKDGFFKGSRRFYPRAGVTSYTRVQLMELNNIGTFSSNSATEITGTDGIKLSFPANGVKKMNGTLYAGDVTVAAKWLDPTASNVTELMPGNLFGLNNKIEEVALASYGMMAVELFGENGESLNVADGKKVELSFPVPSEIAATAPDEIPLWSFEDAQYGIWVEEGKATLLGDYYVGSVSHFSFWNCDAPFPVVYIEGRLLTPNGTPIVDASVKIQVASTNICGYGSTDDEGYFSGKLPAGEVLHLTAGYTFDSCDFESADLGPFDVDTNIGDLVLGDAGSSFDVTGSVVDCAGMPVTNGRVKIVVGNRLQTILLDGDNTFTTGVLNCNNETELVIRADDLDNLVGSDPITLNIAPVVNAGPIMACGNAATEFFTLVVNGDTRTFPTGNVSFEIPTTNEYLFLSVDDQQDTLNPNIFDAFSLQLSFGNVGNYGLSDLNYINISITPPNYTQIANFTCWNQPGQSNCTDLTAFDMSITENGGLGGYLEGNLTGTAIFLDEMQVPFANSFDFSANWRLPIQ